MLKHEDVEGVRDSTQRLQLFIGALAAGVVVFLTVVVLILRSWDMPPSKPFILGLPLLTAVAAAFGVASASASILVPRTLVDGAVVRIAEEVAPEETWETEAGERQVLPKTDAGKLLPVYQTQLLLASVLTEGAAFFAGVAYMLEGHVAALLTACALLALLVSRIPTVDRVLAWLESQLERVSARRRDDY